MADWSSEANEYLEGYLKQVAVLVRQQGDDPEDVVAGLRDHILNEVESGATETVTIERLLPMLAELGSPEEVASIDITTLKSAPPRLSSRPPTPPVEPPAPPRRTKSVVVHRSPASCAIAGCLAAVGLLVGLAVLGIVASILLPAFARSREAARRAECQNNLKELGMGLHQIAAQRDGDMPTVDLHYKGVMFDIDLLYPSVIDDFDVFVCPSGPHGEMDVADDDSEYEFDFDYVYFSHAITNESEALAYLDAVAEAKRTNTPLTGAITMADGTVLPRIRAGDSDDAASRSQIPLIIERQGRHFPEGFNVLFLDGHVEYERLDNTRFPWTKAFAKAMDDAARGT